MYLMSWMREYALFLINFWAKNPFDKIFNNDKTKKNIILC